MPAEVRDARIPGACAPKGNPRYGTAALAERRRRRLDRDREWQPGKLATMAADGRQRAHDEGAGPAGHVRRDGLHLVTAVECRRGREPEAVRIGA